jgi:ketosteroid isomerase-like protein
VGPQEYQRAAIVNHSAVIIDLYAAFAALDAARMGHCYAPDATFEDPVFALRDRTEIEAMWSMLCEAVRAKGREVWQLRLLDHGVDGSKAHATWEARYRFSATGRMVHNRIDARFELRNGLIWRHRDEFSFHRWARQAMGPVGWLLGGTPWLRRKVRSQAASNLARYRGKLPGR